jgi:hypothetical protein
VPDGFGISDVDMIIYLPKPKFYFFYDFWYRIYFVPSRQMHKANESKYP